MAKTERYLDVIRRIFSQRGIKNDGMEIANQIITTTVPPGIAPTPENGLYERPLKYDARIREIRPRMVATQQIELSTSVASRHLRRDFNIASAKMYVFARDTGYREKLNAALGDVTFEISMLKDDIAAFSHMYTDLLKPQRYDMLFISAEGAKMFRILKAADSLFAHLYAAEFAGLITKEERMEKTRPFWLTYSVFKRVAMKLASKSVDEMLAELQLS